MRADDPESVVPLWWPRDQLEADAIRQALEAKGIPCHIEGENQASWAGAGPFGNVGRWRMRLLTQRKFYAEAREFIEGNDWPSFTA